MATELDKSIFAQRDTLALWEILSVATSCLIVEWTVLSFVGRSKLIAAIPIALALGLIAFSYHERGETLKGIGLRVDNFGASLRLLALPTVLAIVAIVVGGRLLGGSDFYFKMPRPRFLLVPVWALFQQYMLQGYINRRAQLALGPGPRSVLLVAIVFSFLHLPNPLLTAITFVGALIWAAVYQRAPNLFSLALSHSAASIALAMTFPQNLINSLRVGFKYFN